MVSFFFNFLLSLSLFVSLTVNGCKYNRENNFYVFRKIRNSNVRGKRKGNYRSLFFYSQFTLLDHNQPLFCIEITYPEEEKEGNLK